MASQDSFDPHTFLAHIGTGRTIVAYRQQSPIFAQGDDADAVFYIQAGQVKLTVVSQQGKEAVIAILEAQAFFGEGCLTGQPQCIATATALTDCALMRIEKSAMMRVLHAEPAFSALFTAYLLSRNSRIEADLIDQLFNPSEKRLARVLLLLAHFGKEGQTELVIPKISQETLAEMIGTTRSRVSFFLNKFRKLGFIDYNGGLHVHSSLLTVVLNDWRLPDQQPPVFSQEDLLGNYFQWLVGNAVIASDKNPMRNITNFRVSSPLPEILFETECAALLTTASSDPRPYLLFLLFL